MSWNQVNKEWIYSKEELQQIRVNCYLKAKELNLEIDKTSIISNTEILKQDEIILCHFLRCLAIACNGIPNNDHGYILSLPWRIIATSIEYFKRFYLLHSFLKYDPRIMMISCIFLAGKVEHTCPNGQVYFPMLMKLHDVMKIYDKCSEQDIMDYEIILIEVSLTFIIVF